MVSSAEVPAEMLDLDHLPADRRAERLARVFLSLSRGEMFWVTGCGQPRHYEHFLHQRFPGEVEWVADFAADGRWIARVTKAA